MMSASDVKRGMLSVIVPVYNGEAHLARALESVLSQSPASMEIIVVDDGSTDGSAEVAARFRPRVDCIRQGNTGPAAARNAGLERARGEFLGFIDADDIWPSGKVDAQLGALTKNDQLGAILGRTRCILPDGSLDAPRFLMHLGCGLYRRAAFQVAGPFDPELRFSEDIDWFTRAREAGIAMEMADDVTLHYRLHDGNVTRGTDVHDLGYLHLVKRSLDRRRTQAGTSVAPSLPELGGFEG